MEWSGVHTNLPGHKIAMPPHREVNLNHKNNLRPLCIVQATEKIAVYIHTRKDFKFGLDSHWYTYMMYQNLQQF